MQVNLKKAAALAAALSAITVTVNHSYAIDIYGDIPTDEMVADAGKLFQAQVNTGLAVVEAAFLIRQEIGKANVVKINGLLTERKKVERMIAVINAIPLREGGANLTALNRQIEAIKSEPKPVYGGNRVPDLVLETASVLKPLASQLRREMRRLDDELQAVNFNTIIEIPDDVVKVLTGFDLI